MKSSVIVIAKEPVAGQVKTRLIPAFGADGAARIALAALLDTIDVVRRVAGDRATLVLSGSPGRWLPDPAPRVLPQRGGGLDERLAAAFQDVAAVDDGPFLLVGMDTPQLSAADLEEADRMLDRHDSVIGPAADGGYWLLGLRRPDPSLLIGVPMSTAETFVAQHDRLRSAGHRTGIAPVLRDVDYPDDVAAVAALAPASRFAAAVRASPVLAAVRP